MADTGEHKDTWEVGAGYEAYVGRWSRLVAREFLKWLDLPQDQSWLDVGSGTGALTQAILETASPREVTGMDPSKGFIEFARSHTADKRAVFITGDASSLPAEEGSYDATVCGLMLNFVPQPEWAVAEMERVTRPGGTVAAYVWDYEGKMEMMRYFWDAAVELNAEAAALDEGVRFPMCNPDALKEAFQSADLVEVEVAPIDVPTYFVDFDDYWSPFLAGQGPAPGYAMSLADEKRTELRDLIRSRLPIEPDGSIHLTARAWAVRGVSV